MKKQDVFEYCLHQLLDRYKEKALKEIEISKNGGSVDMDWTLEESLATDFTLSMKRLNICSFSEPEAIPKGGTHE